MIRVLHCVAGMNRGGIETFIMNIYRNIDRSKIQFDFLVHTEKTCHYDQEIKSMGGKIYSIPPRNKSIIGNVRSLDKFFKNHSEYKIVHQHVSSLSYIEPIRIAKKYGVKTRIVHGHNTRQGGHSFHKYFHYLNQVFIDSYATDCFACSKLAAEWTFPSKILDNNRYSVINNGIETDQFVFNANIRNKTRENMGLNDKFVIGNIGRFQMQKNHNFLIDIFKEIHIRNFNSVLLLVGEGELKPQIEKKVKSLGLESHVIFMGSRNDVSDLLQAMDVFLFPSLNEGLGIVLVEAQASGLKCFASSKVIPEEVDLTGLVNFIDLNNSAEHWAIDVINGKDYERKKTYDGIINKGYDIKVISSQLQKWYLEKINI